MSGAVSRGSLLRVALVVALFVLLALPMAAQAVLEGHNGRIVFVSGRDGGDASANVYLRTIDSGVGGGSTGEAVASAAGQHRHPTWSPDRTMIAYARGDPSCNPGKCDIYVLDLTRPGQSPENITKTQNVNEDRPAWSPDGESIAYESEVSNGSGQTDILIDEAPGGGGTRNLTDTAGAYEGKPAWTPDSDRIFYHRGNPGVAGAMDILRRPADGGNANDVAAAPGISEMQPSLSPDGGQLCFTRGDFTNTGATQVIVSLANGGGQTPLAVNDPNAADYNCTWSPDGTKIAWVQGAFSAGDLVMMNSDNSGGFITLETTAGAFDGNPDWAPDGRPECEDTTVATDRDTPVTIPLSCVDTGPAYERTPVTENIPPPGPANGTLGPLQQGDPSTVTYTPNAGFSGVDTFEFNGFDARQFATRGEVTINVDQPLELLLSGKRKQKLDRALEVDGECNNPCGVVVRGKLTVKTTGASGRVALAKRSFKLKRDRAELDPGAEETFKLKLPKKARRAGATALADGDKVRAKLRGRATGEEDETDTAKRGAKLKRKRKR